MPVISTRSCGVFSLDPMYSLPIAMLLRGTVLAEFYDEQEVSTEAVNRGHSCCSPNAI